MTTNSPFFSQENLISRENTLLFERKNSVFAVGNICNHSDQNQIITYMQDAVVNKVKSKIAHSKFGEVYFVSSFPQYDVEYLEKLMRTPYIFSNLCHSMAYPCLSFAEKNNVIWTTIEDKV